MIKRFALYMHGESQKIKLLRRAALAGAAAFLATAPVNATTFSGHITNISVYPSGSYAFRINTDTTISGCTGNFVYVETTYTNYQALVSTALTAWTLGKVVQLEYSPGTYCQLVDLVTL